MRKRAILSGLDLNVEAQALGLLRTSAEGSYPGTLRRVVVRDEASGKRVTFLTNNCALRPELIAQLYRQRWQVELFFKWIKQHLRSRNRYSAVIQLPQPGCP